MSGILLVDKPSGPSSHGVVSAARKALDTRKIGHAGTLDPMATGLLVLGVGTSTRLLTYLVGADKTYTATIRLGSATVTDDAEGDVIFTADHNVLDAITDDEIQREITLLTGVIGNAPTTWCGRGTMLFSMPVPLPSHGSNPTPSVEPSAPSTST